MALTNLRKSIFYLQQAIREEGHEKDKDLLKALNIMSDIEIRNNDINDPEHYNTTGI